MTAMSMDGGHDGESYTQGLKDTLGNHVVSESLRAHGYAVQRMVGEMII